MALQTKLKRQNSSFILAIPNAIYGSTTSLTQITSMHPNEPNQSQSHRKNRSFSLRDLFIAPSFDELDAVAMDGIGEPRRLTMSQLKTLRDRGYVQKHFFC